MLNGYGVRFGGQQNVTALFRATCRAVSRSVATIQRNTKIIGGATHPSVVGPELASFVPSRDMTPPHASVESSAFHLCELVTKGKTDWELVSHGAKGTKFSKLQTAFRSTPFLCVLCAPSRQRTRWIISTGVLERQNSRSRGQVFDIGILKI